MVIASACSSCWFVRVVCAWALCCGVVFGCGVVFAFSGCATAAKMRPGSADRFDGGGSVGAVASGSKVSWWVIEDAQGIESPIVGIEIASAGDAVHREGMGRGGMRQYIFCDRGIRVFDYEGRRLVHASGPVPPHDTSPDDALLGGAWRHVFGKMRVARGEQSVAGMGQAVAGDQGLRSGMEHSGRPGAIVGVLEGDWSDFRVSPPEGLTYRGIRSELEHFPHGVFELLAAEKAIK